MAERTSCKLIYGGLESLGVGEDAFEEIADAVLFLSSRQAESITGTVLDVHGGGGAGRFFLPYSRG